MCNKFPKYPLRIVEVIQFYKFNMWLRFIWAKVWIDSIRHLSQANDSVATLRSNHSPKAGGWVGVLRLPGDDKCITSSEAL